MRARAIARASPRSPSYQQHHAQQQKEKVQHLATAQALADRAEYLVAKARQRAKTKPLTKSHVKELTIAQLLALLRSKQDMLEDATKELEKTGSGPYCTPEFKVRLQQKTSNKQLKAELMKQVGVVCKKVVQLRDAIKTYSTSPHGSSNFFDDSLPPSQRGWNHDFVDLRECEQQLSEEEDKLQYIEALVEVRALEDDIEAEYIEAELAAREEAETIKRLGQKNKASTCKKITNMVKGKGKGTSKLPGKGNSASARKKAARALPPKKTIVKG